MVPRVLLGKTAIRVSRLCFGTGQLSDFRFNFTPKDAAELLEYGYAQGVNFIDTAIGYRTHPHVGLFVKNVMSKGARRDEIVINTKTNKKTAAEARGELEQALREMGIEYVDTIMLHGIRSDEDLKDREEALAELVKAKKEGLVRAVGASTHIYTGSAMRSCIDEARIEVILCLVNRQGVGLQGGDYATHTELIRAAYDRGKGVLGMKIVGEGYLAEEAESQMRYGFALPGIHALDIGMKSRAQVDMAIAISQGDNVSKALVGQALEGAVGAWAKDFPKSK